MGKERLQAGNAPVFASHLGHETNPPHASMPRKWPMTVSGRDPQDQHTGQTVEMGESRTPRPEPLSAASLRA